MKVILTLIITVLLNLCFGLTQHSWAQFEQIGVKQISPLNDKKRREYVVTSDKYSVWIETELNFKSPQLFLHDFSKNKTFPINNPIPFISIHGSMLDISDNIFIFRATSTSFKTNLYLGEYNPQNEIINIFPLNTASNNANLVTAMKISGQKVVWTEIINGSPKFYSCIFNGSSCPIESIPLTFNSNSSSDFDVEGNTIIYQESIRTPLSYTISLRAYDISSQTAFPIIEKVLGPFATSNYYNIQINKNLVSWTQISDGAKYLTEYCKLDLAQKTCTLNAIPNPFPNANIVLASPSDPYLVFEAASQVNVGLGTFAAKDANSNIYLLETTTGKTTAITENIAPQHNPNISQNTIVWSDLRNNTSINWAIANTQTLNWASLSSDIFAYQLPMNSDNKAPLIQPLNDKSAVEGYGISFFVSASDNENDPLTFSASQLPAGALFTPYIQNVYRFSWVPGFDQAGLYKVIFNVNDGKNTSSASMNIQVQNKNNTPAFDSYTKTYEINAGSTLEFTIGAKDIDGDSMIFRCLSLTNLRYQATPTEFINLNLSQIKAKITFTPTAAQKGTQVISFMAKDSQGASVTGQVTVLVK